MQDKFGIITTIINKQEVFNYNDILKPITYEINGKEISKHFQTTYSFSGS